MKRDFTYISDIVEVPLGTIKSRINRARIQLQAELLDLKQNNKGVNIQMNRYQFEDLISSYIDNEITLSKRKEFERYMKDNPDSEKLVSAIKGNIVKLNQIPRLKVKSSFNDTLKSKIDDFNSNPRLGKDRNLIFGFSPLNASFLFGLFIAFIFINKFL